MSHGPTTSFCFRSLSTVTLVLFVITVTGIRNGNAQSSPLSVDGFALGSRLSFESDSYKKYKCTPSEKFAGLTWCHKEDTRIERKQEITLSNSILHAPDGTALYLNKYIEPAFFAPSEARSEIDRLSSRFGERARQIRLQREGLPNAIIAAWGQIRLEQLDSDELAAVASNGRVRGLLVGFLGDLQHSAKLGTPVYRLAGGAGFVWAATFNQDGRGVLRFLTIDASKIELNVHIAQRSTVGDPEPPEQGPQVEKSASPAPLSGHDSVDKRLSEDAPPTECDTYASSDYEPSHKSAGIRLDDIKANLGVPACEAAVKQFPNNVRLIFQLGRAYQKASDFDSALAQYRKAASSGYRHAQTNLGVMYERGQGVPQDYAEAVIWYRKAADQGEARAQGALGAMYEHGRGVPQDNAEAVIWYRKAADQASAWAQVQLGLMYEHGKGVPQDYGQAVAWFYKAAASGYAAGQYDLGSMYWQGKGVPQDYAQALTWIRKASEQGYASAQNNLGVMYEHGNGVPQDYGQAVAWYRKAADQGDAWGQWNLGAMFENGRGVQQDYQQAIVLYRKAAEQGHARAENALGVMYENGRGVAQDYAQAIDWYRNAADAGIADAQYELGQMYESGRGVAKDYEQAIAWYQRAAAQGKNEAKERLVELTRKRKPSDTGKPTLEQTAAYIVSGGYVEIDDMDELQDGTVAVPSYNIAFFPMPNSTIKVQDRTNCIVTAEGLGLSTWYFNKVIVSQIYDEPLWQYQHLGDMTKIHLDGEDAVVCVHPNGTTVPAPTCLRENAITVQTSHLSRVHKAIDYLYANFCTSASRQKPF